MPLLPARLLAGPFAKTADADRLLLQAVARRRFAAVATIEPKLAFQLRDPLMKLCDQGLLLRGKDFELRCKGCQNLQRGVCSRSTAFSFRNAAMTDATSPATGAASSRESCAGGQDMPW